MLEYKDYRNNIKSGDLLSWVIGNRVLVIEAVEPKVRIYPLSKLGNFYHVPMGMSWNDEVEEAALSKIGEDYKQLHAIKAYFKALAKDDVSECAALYLYIAKLAGIDLGSRATPDAVIYRAQLLGKSVSYIVNT